MTSRFDMECYKHTTDWWCGNYFDNLVRVSLSMITPDGEYWRVGVWGTDDMGMIKDFESEYPYALDLYHTLLRKNDITINLLVELGFESF